ncbi:uncharacterized protein BO66DRAFT_232874 [Aspergillus aculeatinus CBS 121060]|uniref:Uncharacterized protein n=1 Tax=Aspergillus aculeatinus CBS 121060 TaxID=1448322 RepID=A0ACD1GTR6_9EURO|nr:hypothetical protein BO66DRAFT_232874 [Aspergillus aculeatinus CBS 121060]RAH64659.1 hypothetical protein BO66DRAFT_232874 [Aspergillus aculeatinus CBS 121060]
MGHLEVDSKVQNGMLTTNFVCVGLACSWLPAVVRPTPTCRDSLLRNLIVAFIAFDLPGGPRRMEALRNHRVVDDAIPRGSSAMNDHTESTSRGEETSLRVSSSQDRAR